MPIITRAKKEDHEDSLEHHSLDPHIWRSPPLVQKQARTILRALQTIDPTHATFYEANFRQFSARIDTLHGELKKLFAGSSAQVLVSRRYHRRSGVRFP